MSNKTEQDVAFIEALADLLRKSDLSEIEVEREYGDGDELKVRLSRTVSVAPAPVAQVAVQAAAPAQPAAAPVAAPAPAEQAPAGPDLSNAVTSPMVGTVYLAPEPGAANFVSPGDEVQEGQTVLIIEAMKTMNNIPAPRSGRVRTIMVDNAEPVEFGEPLLIIE
ncbi:MAG: acetyl-CoA carboxylase biotin carboxyl carrier protein [Pseudomonadota bacterium]